MEVAADAARPPAIRKVAMDAPFRWLAGSMGDLARAPLPSYFYHLASALISVGLTAVTGFLPMVIVFP